MRKNGGKVLILEWEGKALLKEREGIGIKDTKNEFKTP